MTGWIGVANAVDNMKSDMREQFDKLSSRLELIIELLDGGEKLRTLNKDEIEKLRRGRRR